MVRADQWPSGPALDSQGCLEEARRYAVRSRRGVFEEERIGYRKIAEGFLSLAKSAARREFQGDQDWGAVAARFEHYVWSGLDT